MYGICLRLAGGSLFHGPARGPARLIPTRGPMQMQPWVRPDGSETGIRASETWWGGYLEPTCRVRGQLVSRVNVGGAEVVFCI
jgi:hypothetical protein